MSSPIAKLAVNGIPYEQWESISIMWGMETFCPSFTLGISDTWAEAQLPLPFNGFDAVTVDLDNGDLKPPERVITGFIDRISQSQGASGGSQLTLTGRADTGHMVDASAVHPSGRWKDVTPIEVVRAITQPFSSFPADFSDPSPLKPFRRFAIQDGESVFEVLDRIASLRARLWMTSALGGPVLTTAGGFGVALSAIVRGQNVISSSFEEDFRDRFGEYTVKGQSAGDETWFAADAKGAFFTAVDEQITVHRPKILEAEGTGTVEECTDQAKWNLHQAAARSRRFRYTVQGWSHLGGLWMPNTTVRVQDTRYQINEDMLIVSANYTAQRGSGTKTVLEMGAPEQFDLLQPPPRVEARLLRRAW